jgi:hypothetical protein
MGRCYCSWTLNCSVLLSVSPVDFCTVFIRLNTVTPEGTGPTKTLVVPVSFEDAVVGIVAGVTTSGVTSVAVHVDARIVSLGSTHKSRWVLLKSFRFLCTRGNTRYLPWAAKYHLLDTPH